ncbi:hypothetical protein ASE28_24220 [Acidovorax sp. Root219]|nr:hypothetical protein ASE28_24220 [Acidovorax sp. Root219]
MLRKTAIVIVTVQFDELNSAAKYVVDSHPTCRYWIDLRSRIGCLYDLLPLEWESTFSNLAEPGSKLFRI